jgi:asparagine synthase (glutamine-hydrolysing)
VSAVACVFNREGGPIERGCIRRITAALGHHGPDGGHIVLDHNAALAFQHCWSLPEDIRAVQPIEDHGNRLVFAFDGRLDNRDELVAALGAANRHRADATIAASAYLKWGNAAFARLVGPFVFVIRDLEHRSLVVARDPLGGRPLHYVVDRRRFLAASEAAALLADPTVSDAADEARCAAFFAMQWPNVDNSFFSDIKVLLPGHYLEVSADHFSVQRFWSFDPTPDIDIDNDRLVYQRFRELLDQAVRCRLRSRYPVAVSMSGGLDSTSVTAMAVRHQPVKAYSFVFEELPECDERPNLQAMIDHLGLEFDWLNGDSLYTRLADLDDAGRSSPVVNTMQRLKLSLYRAAREDGRRVILVGDGGDELYSRSTDWLRDLLRRGRYAEFAGAIRAGEYSWSSVRHLLPEWIGLRRHLTSSSPPWLTDHARHKLPPPTVSPLVPADLHLRQSYDFALGEFAASSLTAELPGFAAAGVERRCPYRDRRLVEFVLRLPAFYLYRARCSKPLVRQGMRDLLPERVLASPQIGFLTALYRRGLDAQATAVRERLVDGPGHWRAFVDPRWIGTTAAAAPDSPFRDRLLWCCLCFDRWRQAVADRAR